MPITIAAGRLQQLARLQRGVKLSEGTHLGLGDAADHMLRAELRGMR